MPVTEDQAKQPEPAATETKSMAVISAFTLTRDSGEKVIYGPGYHESVPVADADHFWAKLHQAPDGKMPKPAAKPGDAPSTIKALQGQVDDLTRQHEAAKNELAKSQDQVRAHEERISQLEADKAELEKPKTPPKPPAK